MKSQYETIEAQYGKRAAYLREPPLLYKLMHRFETHRVDKVSALIPNKKYVAMEVGCGDGKFLYQNKAKWKRIIGVDIIPAQLQRSKKKKYGVPVKFLRKDFGNEKVPLETSSIDLIVSISTIQYLLDLDLFLTQCHRVLKNGGQLVIEVPNSAVFWRRIGFLFGNFPVTSEYTNKWNGGVIHYFTRKNLASFLERKGFMVERVSCSGIFHSLREFFPGFLGADLIFVCTKRV